MAFSRNISQAAIVAHHLGDNELAQAFSMPETYGFWGEG
jgi:hypothetical protein